MRKESRLLLLMIAAVAVGLMGASISYAVHTGGSVTLKASDGTDIGVGSQTPYSPKQSCGVCHNYESDAALATKDHGAGTASYQVPYPRHGVTAGYHFQQGRNLDWGDRQREYYHVPNFTSSGGMYGKH